MVFFEKCLNRERFHKSDYNFCWRIDNFLNIFSKYYLKSWKGGISQAMAEGHWS